MIKKEFDPVPIRMLYGPAAYCARGIEKLLIHTKESVGIEHLITCVAARTLALTAFPVTLVIGLIVEPFALTWAVVRFYAGDKEAGHEWAYSAERLEKLALGLIFTPLAFVTSDAVSYLFLEREKQPKKVLPFGVENVFGTDLTTPIRYPSTIEEVQQIVKEAKKDHKTISIIGAGMSQGTQTVPNQKNGIVINLKNLNQVAFFDKGDQYIKADAGAIWEQVQYEANKKGKSVIVKQASDLFSVGGSIGINCHGWQHDSGSIASVVDSLEIIDANGELRNVSREKDPELFGCMFGTLGYFGIVVSATLRLEDNTFLQERGVDVPIKDFTEYYKSNVKNNKNKPLLMGRLNIDGKPLTKVYFNTFDKVLPEINLSQSPIITESFEFEKHRGARIERIYLDAVGHLPKSWYDSLAKFYWDREVKIMDASRVATRNEIMHFGVKSFFQLHQSDLYTQWLQEYFISEENLPSFIEFLGETLEENDVRLLNASIRPVPKDEISVLPYAEKDRYAIVISFHQQKTKNEMQKTEKWIKEVQKKLLNTGDKWYQAYMPYATQEEFEQCYGPETVKKMRELKKKYDENHVFSNAHTAKYFDVKEKEKTQ